MSAQELNRVHRRYIKISNGFKSAWTFHQFIQGLRKVFVDEGPPPYEADFQTIYAELKEVSKNLSEVTVNQAEEQLDRVEKGLTPIVQNLFAADNEVSPGLLRQFFQRVKNYDDNILSQLVRFYLFFRDEGWNRDRLDKADYLTTKVCEELQPSSDIYVMRDRTQARELAQGFWAALGAEPVEEVEVAALLEELEQVREEFAGAESLDDLNREHLVQRYRDFKHRLGDTFFQPRVLQAIIDTNLVLKNHVKRLYKRDEERIVAEYQQVFELEREVPIDLDLKQDLAEFRSTVEQFEKRLGGESVRLDELAGLREQVRKILPRLQLEASGSSTIPTPPELREEKEAPVTGGQPAEEHYVEAQYRSIVKVLDDTSSSIEAKRVTFQPEVFSLGLDPREVVAYRRIFSDEECDRDLEEFILRAAALRHRIEQDVDKIKGILDDSAVSRDAPAFREARPTVRFGDFFLRRFDHLAEQAVLDQDHGRARLLQILKMRLIRSYAGLWLMLYREL